MKTLVMISCFEWYENRLAPIMKILEQNNIHVKIILSDFPLQPDTLILLICQTCISERLTETSLLQMT